MPDSTSFLQATERSLRRCLPTVISAIDAATPGSFQAVDIGTFSRKKQADHDMPN